MLPPPQGCGAWRAALGTYRTWLLGFMYALSFGTELTVDNILAQYIFDTFDVSHPRRAPPVFERVNSHCPEKNVRCMLCVSSGGCRPRPCWPARPIQLLGSWAPC